MTTMHTGGLLACLWLAAAWPAQAQQTQQAEDARDAKIARLEQTVQRLVQRIELLEAERDTAPVADTTPATTAAAQDSRPAAPVTPAIAAADDHAKPALAMPDESPLPARPTFDEDELAGARADNEVPPGEKAMEGFFLIGDSNTWLRLGGYAKLDAMVDSDDAGFSDQFIPATFPVGAQSGRGAFNMHARQTRFTVQAMRPTDYGWLKIMLQNDFFGPGRYGYNLRHAWGQLGNTYVGYGFSAFMDLDASPDTLDFAGPGVVPFGRVTSVRQYLPLKNGHQLIFAAEHLAPEISAAAAGVHARNTLPNLVAAWRHESGHGHVQVSTLLRRLAWSGDAGRDETLAGGVTVTGSWGGQAGSYLTWGALGGRGIAAYVGDQMGMGLDGVVDADGTLQALDQWGGWAGYGHPWNDRWRSTLTWGRVYLQRSDLLAADAFRRSDYAAVNLIYAPAPSWSWGMELLYGRLQQQDGDSGDVFRVQSSLKYDFIK